MAYHQLVALDQAETQLRESTLTYDDETGEILLDLAPVSPSSVVNRAYVDEIVGGGYVLKSGDTMTGPLVLPGAPTAPNQASTKAYVDGIQSSLQEGIAINAAAIQTLDQNTYSKVETDETFLTIAAAGEQYLSLQGGSMTGALLLAADPADDLEAATKAYVDAHAGGNDLPDDAEGYLHNDGEGNLEWQPAAGDVLPADAEGYLYNDGAGELTWAPGLGGAYLPLDGSGQMLGAIKVNTSQYLSTAADAALNFGNNTFVYAKPDAAVIDWYLNSTMAARMEPAGTIASHSMAMITKQKGDARYLQLTGGTLTDHLVINSGARPSLSATRTDYPSVYINNGEDGLRVDGSGTTNRLIRLLASDGSDAFRIEASGAVSMSKALTLGGNIIVNNGLSFTRADGPSYITSADEQILNFRTGTTVNARIDPAGTTSPNAQTVITRQKGDARYATTLVIAALLDQLVAANVLAAPQRAAVLAVVPDDPPDDDLPDPDAPE